MVNTTTFNAHGQMLYNWIISTGTDSEKVNVKDNEDLDEAEYGDSIADMRYAFNVDKGWRVDGWLLVDGSYSLDKANDEDWYFFDDGEAKYDEDGVDVATLLTSDSKEYGYVLEDPRYRAKVKVEGKYFCFDQDGRMKTGLQAIGEENTDGTVVGL